MASRWLVLAAPVVVAVAMSGFSSGSPATTSCSRPPVITGFMVASYEGSDIIGWHLWYRVRFAAGGGDGTIRIFEGSWQVEEKSFAADQKAVEGGSWHNTHESGDRVSAEATIETACGTARRSLEVGIPGGQSQAVIGDSFASGEGNPPYLEEAEACHVSEDAWPRQLAGWLGNRPADNFACSGAKISALTGRFKNQPPQLDRLKAGYELVLVMIGGNDAGFSRALVHCVAVDCSLNGWLERTTLKVRSVRPKLAKALRAVQAAVGRATVVAVGYPRLFPASQADVVNCGWLEPQERIGLNGLAAELDRVTRLAARDAAVGYVSTLNAFHGYELCRQFSYVRPIGGRPLTAGGHPAIRGHRQIALAVEKYLMYG